MSQHIGPALPPGFGKKKEEESQSSNDSETDIGPALPPSHHSSSTRSAKNDSDEDVYGPLPPQSLCVSHNTNKPRVVGPSMPPGRKNITATQSDSSDDEFIGPSLDMAAPADARYDAAAEFAARNNSLEAERKRVEDEKAQKAAAREEWMMSLPTIGLAQDIGLTARTFRNKAAPLQDSSWTKAPNQKGESDEDKAPERSATSGKRHYTESNMAKRDQEIAEKLGKLSDSNRKVSLVEMHQKKLKKEKKEKEKEKGDKMERVPFSRETDLQVNKFDEAQRKSILKKAALLDTRFGHGSQKYE